MTAEGTFSVFSWAYAQPSTSMWPSRFPGIARTFKKTSYGHLILQFLFLRFLVRFLCALTIIAISSTWDITQLLLNVFDKPLQEKTICIGQTWVRVNKDKPCEWGFQGNCQIMTVIWVFGEILTVFCLLQWLLGCWSFCDYGNFSFQHYHTVGERGVEIGQVQMLQRSLFLLRFRHFSWKSVPNIVLNL